MASVAPPNDLPALAAASDRIVYVSLPPDTFPTGVRAIIQNPRTGDNIWAPIVSGGLDPVPLAADTDDELQLDVRDGSGALVAHLELVVPAMRKPRVARVYPPPKKRDVVLNARPVIFFTEPIESNSLTQSSVQLLRGSSEVPGTVKLLEGTGATVAFIPAASLAANAEYRLVVSEAVEDVDGDALDQRTTVEFTTGTATGGAPALIRVTPDTISMSGGTYQLTATVEDAAGNLLIDQPVTWSTSDPNGLSVSSTGLLTGLRSGDYRVSARVGDRGGEAYVYLRGAPASVEVSPSADTVPAEETITLSTIVRDAAGFAVSGARVTWTSSAAGVAAVSPSGWMATVTGISPGSATITASAGNVSGTSSVTVGPRRTIASVTVSPASASLVPGDEVRMSAVVKDADGDVIPNRSISWTSADPAVARVDADGVARAVGKGATVITATSEGVTGTASVSVTVLEISSVDAGYGHTCAITTLGAAYCWGRLLRFVDGVAVPSPLPLAVPGGMAFVTINSGMTQNCGLAASGSGFCWTLGLPGGPTPVAEGLTLSRLTAGGTHTCALTTGGVAYCWGRNFRGQLGIGSSEDFVFVATPVAGGLTLKELDVGASDHTCGLALDGSAYCWGRGQFGQLGNGSTEDQFSPVPVSGGLSFVAITLGYHHTCGLTANGAAYCWGIGRQLGNAAGTLSLVPVPVEGGLTFTGLGAGYSHTCGIATGGALYCWGQNEEGRVGNGTTAQALLPSPVQGGLTFAAVSGGGGHTCGRTTAGVVYCWGANSDGQLGNGTTTNSTVPVKVAGQP